jgi:hypothetical protein
MGRQVWTPVVFTSFLGEREEDPGLATDLARPKGVTDPGLVKESHCKVDVSSTIAPRPESPT